MTQPHPTTRPPKPWTEPSVDLLIPGLLPNAGPVMNTDTPAAVTDPKLALFQCLVVSTEHGNLLKKRINASSQLCRDDPSVTTVVSDDELEDPMPDIAEFLELPNTANVPTTREPTLESSGSDPSGCPLASNPRDPAVMTGPNALSLSDRISGATSAADILALLGAPQPLSPPQTASKAFDWAALGPAYTIAEASANQHELNPSSIPDALIMMMHLM